MSQQIQLFLSRLITLFILAILLYGCASSKHEDLPRDFGFQDEPLQHVEPVTVQTPAKQKAPVLPNSTQPEKKPVFVAIRPDTPDSYTVKRGDTLWDIASLFLRDPWLWPEIWYFNPQIENPHLIYPGDVIALVYVDGKPRLQFARDHVTELGHTEPSPITPTGIPTLKLSPKIRRESLESAIPTIPINAIQPFLVKPRVISKEELEAAPYILSSLDDHLVSATGHIVYVRGLNSDDEVRYNVFRPGRVFRNPRNNEILGYETVLVSEAKLQKFGDPATLILTNSKRETLNGDRILPAEKGEINYNFIPRAPDVDVQGEIIGFIDAISHTAQNQVVIINLGQRDGIDVGNVLAIDQTGSTVRDNYSKRGQEVIKLPNIRVGVLMVFRAFDRVSYALIMQSERTIHLHDTVRNPAPVVDAIIQ